MNITRGFSVFLVLVLFYNVRAESFFKSLNKRIVDGFVAENDEMPYLARLKTVSGRSGFGAGALISLKWVVTAAHCLVKYEQIRVIIGTGHRIKETGAQVRIVNKTEFIIHPEYLGTIENHDIGLMRILEPFIFEPGKVQPVELFSGMYKEYGIGKVCGWGRDVNQNHPRYLQCLYTNVIGYNNCAESLKPNRKLKNTMICSVNPGLVQGACKGDSGGPLVRLNIKKHRTKNGTNLYEIKEELVGIVSWVVKSCSSPNTPSVYVKVRIYKDWIESEMRLNELLEQELNAQNETTTEAITAEAITAEAINAEAINAEAMNTINNKL
ncbi:lectizyme-like [Teleopsis dalmanni]|uniref:lectizyme-like n=1 Tax=Teleopsis dalmanni TaxID=139649 RepID=UPI0018CF8FBB|nr:lectizyme-like [Teleopsis dalmanni]